MRNPWPVLLFVWVAGACGGSSATGSNPSLPGSAEAGEGRGRMEVYDEKGHAKSCTPPSEGCEPKKSNPDFTDQCALRGYRTMRCGCETVCTGNVMAPSAHYDARGRSMECAPVDSSCTPPETSATFQDACADAHHRLVVCGCEWLCDGPPKR